MAVHKCVSVWALPRRWCQSSRHFLEQGSYFIIFSTIIFSRNQGFHSDRGENKQSRCRLPNLQ